MDAQMSVNTVDTVQAQVDDLTKRMDQACMYTEQVDRRIEDFAEAAMIDRVKMRQAFSKDIQELRTMLFKLRAYVNAELAALETKQKAQEPKKSFWRLF